MSCGLRTLVTLPLSSTRWTRTETLPRSARSAARPKTRILGADTGALNTVTADPDHNEIFLPVGKGLRGGGTGGVQGVYVFDRLANGDVAPKRVLAGPDTMINSATPQVAIDSMRNLLIVQSGGALLIFNREADGNTKPLRVSKGPKTD